VLHLLLLVALQTADGELSRIEEWSKSQPENGPGAVGIGDEYFKASKKFPKEKQKFIDHANEWWSKGWPNLDQFWKDKARENFKKLYASPAGGATKPLSKPEWTGDGSVVTGERVHSGNFAAKMAMPKGNEGNFAQPLKTEVKVPPGAKEIEISAWVLADGTNNANDDMKPLVYGAGAKLLSATGTAIEMDIPVWRKISQTVSAEGATRVQVVFEFQSRQGVVFVDDVSIKCDGKEILTNGGFEK
jgi:hypothetical protein